MAVAASRRTPRRGGSQHPYLTVKDTLMELLAIGIAVAVLTAILYPRRTDDDLHAITVEMERRAAIERIVRTPKARP